ncbi:MAG: hypothetical protein R3B60_01855 [Candidatus Paceibacterota bacterium]
MISTNFINFLIQKKTVIMLFLLVGFIAFTGSFYVDNKVEAANLAKPSITYLNGNPTMGSFYGIFWASTVDISTYTDYQLKVNSTILDFKSDGRNSYTPISLVEYYGFKVGQNDISVRICNGGTCGAWSDSKIIDIKTGWNTLCTAYQYGPTKTVVAGINGPVYGVNPAAGIFTADSDLATLAIFLGAPVGGTATLQITNATGCASTGNSSITQNGVSLTPFSTTANNKKKLMNVVCTSGCTGGTGNSGSTSGGANNNSGTINYCLGNPAPASQTVIATTFGSVYGSGPFTTSSDLGKIAAYLGAPVGSQAQLQITDAGCLNNYRSGTNNGSVAVPWYSTWHGMTVTCTSGCTLGNTSNNNTGNTNTSGNTTNTTNSSSPYSSASVCLGNPAPASQTVTSENSSYKFIYGTGPFTTGSDLGKIAAYLGAPVGSQAQLQITDIGCIQNYNYTTQNGVTSTSWPASWRGMTVVCTSGCTGTGSNSSDTSIITSTNNSLEKVTVMTEPVGFGVFNKRMGEQFAIAWYTEGVRKTNVNNQLFDTVQIRINSNIEQLSVSETFSNSAKDTFRFETQLVPYNGYQTGDNNISVRLCKSSSGCGPWSDDYTLRVGGWISCGITAKPVTKTVTAKSSGIVYGGETGNGSFRHSDGKLYPYNVFGSESDFSAIATYLGAKVGTTATLEVSRGFHCPDKVYSDTKNGITTKTYSNITNKIGGYQPGVNIVCTSGCTGTGSGSSGTNSGSSSSGNSSSNTYDINDNTVLYDDPLVSGLTKPKLCSGTGVCSGNLTLGGIYSFSWAWSVPDSVRSKVTKYQVKINSTITEKAPEPNGSSMLYVYEYNGFKIGDNAVQVRICDDSGCGPWSDTSTMTINAGWYLLCSVYHPTFNVDTISSDNGNLYKIGSNSTTFSTDSDLGTVAAFLGAKIGDKATLSLTNNGICSQDINTTITRNGITSATFLGSVTNKKRNVDISCTSGCN